MRIEMAEKLREYRVKFERMPEGRKAVPDPHRLGVRSKLGGEPDWEQGPQEPECRGCQEAMTFVAQIDSIEHDEKHNPHRVDCLSEEQRYMFGDVGMIYVFFCFDCLEAKSVFQCG